MRTSPLQPSNSFNSPNTMFGNLTRTASLIEEAGRAGNSNDVVKLCAALSHTLAEVEQYALANLTPQEIEIARATDAFWTQRLLNAVTTV